MLETTSKTLFSKRMSGGKDRSYFIDVKESEKGFRYLQMCESRLTEGVWKSFRLILFPRHLKEWKDTLEEALTHLDTQESA